MMWNSRRTCVGAILTFILLPMLSGVSNAGDKFGDSTATASRICINNTLILGKYLSASGSGVLDSMRIWARNNDGGTDTIVACIYTAGGSLLGRSRDSAIVPNDNLNPYTLHFNNQTISISSSTRFWIGAQLRASGTSTNARIGTASSTDTLYLGTDVLPLESSFPTGNKYYGAGVEAVRVTAYYSTQGESQMVTRRRRVNIHAAIGKLERKNTDEILAFGSPDLDLSDGNLSGIEPGCNSHCQ